jgi:tRNA-Thr(GGU) m(6)t(6)A37 methyltransferase TsaA
LSVIEPIGWISCPQRYRYEAPRQGVLLPERTAVIHLHEGRDFEAGLDGLDGFERIWVVFEFHLNETWHPVVQPPHEGEARHGVFATRSPHRPNRVGLTCVRLVRVEGLQLTVAGHDLLDGTPVWDLKPYVPYADAFPDASAGWLDEVDAQQYEVEFTAQAAATAAWILAHGHLDCVNFAQVQLMSDPTDAERKRITREGSSFVIAYRTWRLHYRVAEPAHSVTVTRISSGYSARELEKTEDRHAVKQVHRDFAGRTTDANTADEAGESRRGE